LVIVCSWLQAVPAYLRVAIDSVKVLLGFSIHGTNQEDVWISMPRWPQERKDLVAQSD
jgi:hypothetical protein